MRRGIELVTIGALAGIFMAACNIIGTIAHAQMMHG